ncbi:hypothetical protein RFI_17359, partial [Reticulomyxa filosa]
KGYVPPVRPPPPDGPPPLAKVPTDEAFWTEALDELESKGFRNRKKNLELLIRYALRNSDGSVDKMASANKVIDQLRKLMAKKNRIIYLFFLFSGVCVMKFSFRSCSMQALHICVSILFCVRVFVFFFVFGVITITRRKKTKSKTYFPLTCFFVVICLTSDVNVFLFLFQDCSQIRFV